MNEVEATQTEKEQDADTTMMEIEPTEPTIETITPPAATEVSNTTTPTAETTTPTNASRSQCSAVSMQRTAAVGISSDAPANENPDVLAAVMESICVDPAFLKALPLFSVRKS